MRSRAPYLTRRVAGRAGYRRIARVGLLLLIDLIGISLAIFSALAVKATFEGNSFEHVVNGTLKYVPFAFTVIALLFARDGLYGARETRPGLARTITALCQATVVALVLALVSGTTFSSYWIFYGSLFFAAVYICGLRKGYEWATGRLLSSLGYQRRSVLVGSADRITAVAHALEDREAYGCEAVGFFALDDCEENGLADLGEISELPQRLEELDIGEVIITDPDFSQASAVDLIDLCHDRGIRVRVAPSTMDVLTQRAELVPGQGVPLFEIHPPVFDGFDYLVKRSFDLIAAGIGLIIISPLLAVIAVAVKLTSRGPILHRSVRPGIGGRPFRCLKFRTMYEGSEERQHELEHLNEASGPIFKIREDPRVTPLGRFLRRNSLDELPQLINVLRGEMSLVGPRPLPVRDHARLEDWHRRRYLVLPGITGLWQVSGRSNLDFDDMVRLDFLYLERWSVLLDLTILLKTIPAVIRRRGAY